MQSKEFYLCAALITLTNWALLELSLATHQALLYSGLFFGACAAFKHLADKKEK